jgi:putative selenium metabolism protein SsnA
VILFRNVRLIAFDPPSVSDETDLLVGDDGKIAAIAPRLAGTQAAAGARTGGSGGFLSPGLVVGHAHLYSTLSRGMSVAIEPSKDFAQMLDHVWWRLDRAIDEDIIRASGLAGAAEAARCGVTTIIDHHASPFCIDGSLSVLGDSIAAVGLRSILCFETTDRNGADGAAAGIRENERYADECLRHAAVGSAIRSAVARGGGLPLRGAMIGAHAPFTLEDDTLAALGESVRRTGAPFHIHVAEDRYDASASRARYGLDPIVRLDRFGCLSRNSIVAHGLYLGEDELDLMTERGARLAHNARSNMNNAVGYARLLPRAGDFLLGTDGMGSDMLEELRFAYFKHRDAGGPLGSEAFVRALGRNGSFAAEVLGGTSGATPATADQYGLKVGAPADLVHWDYESPTPIGSDNLSGHLVFGLSSRDVRSTLVAGRFIVENRKPAFDSAAIAVKANEGAVRLWKRMEEGK